MFGIYVFLQIYVSAREINIYPNEIRVIDTFQEFGIVLGANITYQSQNAQQCQIIKQRLINIKSNETILVPQMKESIFSQLYLNGSYSQLINYNQILSMVLIPQGTVILFSNGTLFYLQDGSINNKFIIGSNYSLQIGYVPLNDTVFMYYLSTSQQILIILYNQIIYVSINSNESNIFGQVIQFANKKLQFIKNIVFLDDFLFILGNTELAIYSVSKNTFVNGKQLNSKMIYVDIAVLYQNGTYQVFCLHRIFGVTQFNYDPNLQQFEQITSLNQITQKGYKIGLYNSILIIIDELEEESIVYELNYLQTNNSWQLCNTQKASKNIKNIQLTEYYAILIGSNGHEIIYHSLPNKVFKVKNEIVIPGLIQIYFLNQTQSYNYSLIGITKYAIFTSYFYLSPQKIKCQSSKDSTPIQFTYYQNSTQCSQLKKNEQGKLCLYIVNYRVNQITPLITSEYNFHIQIGFLLFLIIVTIIICLFIIQRQKYKKLLENKTKIYAQSPSQQLSVTNILSNATLSPNNDQEKNFLSPKYIGYSRSYQAQSTLIEMNKQEGQLIQNKDQQISKDQLSLHENKYYPDSMAKSGLFQDKDNSMMQIINK